MARQERSAGFIIFHRLAGGASEAEYLLLDYGRYWDFPKGHVEAGESDLEAAERELAEETGLRDARVTPGFQREIVYFFRDRKGRLIRKTAVFLLAETTIRAIALSDEHVGFAFLPFDAAISRVTYPAARKVLQQAHGFLAQIGV